MLVSRATQLVVVAILLCGSRSGASPRRSLKFKICGRQLGDYMSHICRVYNSPSSSGDVPVVEQPTRRRRASGPGIADECCELGCTWAQLTGYCAVVNSEALETLNTHFIEDRSAEEDKEGSSALTMPAMVGEDKFTLRKRTDGAEGGRRENIASAARAAPVVGTVSPLLTWGRTLNTDLPQQERDRYAYVGVYAA